MHELPQLPYAHDALEPFIDKKTMEIHHGKHHQGYVNKLNKALEGHADLQEKSCCALLKDLNALPEAVRTKVRNAGGGHYNHTIFWKIMKPGGSPCSGAIAEAINAAFGSLEAFQEKFSTAAATVFGSGWAWLVWNGSGLEIVQTANQDTPRSQGKFPLLGIDVWEHAYYILRQADRGAYIKAWWNIVNWEEVNLRLEKAKQ